MKNTLKATRAIELVRLKIDCNSHYCTVSSDRGSERSASCGIEQKTNEGRAGPERLSCRKAFAGRWRFVMMGAVQQSKQYQTDYRHRSMHIFTDNQARLFGR